MLLISKNKEISYDELLNLVTSQQKQIKELTSNYQKLSNDYEQLKLVIAMNKARTFKPKNESIDKEELNLFNYNEVEVLASTTLANESRDLQTKKVRKIKSKNHADIDFESLVAETVIHEDKNCDHDKVLISEDVT